MSESDGRVIGGFIGFIVVWVLFGLGNQTFLMEKNVLEVTCLSEWEVGRVCKGILVPGNRIEYLINPLTKNVRSKLALRQGEIFPTTIIYPTCNIVDSDNWVCGVTEKVSFEDGTYARYNFDTPNSYIFYGVTGWRYWLARLGFTQIAFSRLSSS